MGTTTPGSRKRILFVLAVDISGSMRRVVNELNEGLQGFSRRLRDTPYESDVVLITFGESVTVSETVPGSEFSPSRLLPKGRTPMAEAILVAVKVIETWISEQEEKSIPIETPEFILFTDGRPSDRRLVPRARASLQSLEESGKVLISPYAVTGADGNFLRSLSLEGSFKTIRAADLADKISIIPGSRGHRFGSTGLFRLHVAEPPPLYQFTEILQKLDSAYNQLRGFEVHLHVLLADLSSDRGPIAHSRDVLRKKLFQLLDNLGNEKGGRTISPEDRVRIKGIEIHSPGLLEFFARLNPLEQIRLYLNDRHQRKMTEGDKALDWKMKEVKYYRELAAFMKDLGVSDEEIRLAISTQLIAPLKPLDEAVDSGFIVEAEVVEIEPES